MGPDHLASAKIAAKVFPALPAGHLSFRIGPDQYAVWQGRYFLHGPRGFSVARPPVGAFVLDLPIGFETVFIAGMTYFLLAGVYYQRSGNGYIVVEPPVPSPVPASNGEQFLVVDTELLNVRSGPGADNQVISQVCKGFQYRVEGASPGWYSIRLANGQLGWVMSQYTHIVVPGAKG
jgi:hypothetical protein